MINTNSKKKINSSRRFLEKFWKFSNEFPIFNLRRSLVPDFVLNQFDIVSSYSSDCFYYIESDDKIISVLKELGKSLKSNSHIQIYLFSHSLYIVYEGRIYSNSEDGLKSLFLSRV